MVRHDRTLRCFDTDGNTVFNQNLVGWSVRKGLKLAACDSLIDEITCYFLRSWCYETCLWIPHSALDLIFLKKRKLLFRFSGRNHISLGSKGFSRTHLTNELQHAVVVILASDFHATDFDVVPALFVEFPTVVTRPDSKLVVRRHVAEIRCVRCRANVGWNR